MLKILVAGEILCCFQGIDKVLIVIDNAEPNMAIDTLL